MKSYRTFNKDTLIFGIVGFPLSHTLSPLIHNTLFTECGINAVYLVFENSSPENGFLDSAKGLKIRGLSVTIPHKIWAYNSADFHDETSKYMKSSNTLIFSDNGINAFNTDGYGAVRSIEESGINFFKKKSGDILILGSGGSARGISYALLQKDSGWNKIIISGRNSNSGKDLEEDLNSYKAGRAEFIPVSEIENEKKRFSLIINTTPVGMKGNTGEQILSGDFFTDKSTLFDIVYNPVETPLVKMAKKQGARIIPGYEMLIHQAMKQFLLFTGTEADRKLTNKVRKKIIKALK